MMMPLGWVGGDQVKVVLVGLVVMVGGERPSGSEWCDVCGGVGGMHRHYIIMTSWSQAHPNTKHIDTV